MTRSIRNFLAMLTMLVSVSANATTDFYGTLLAGSYQPTDPFASLTYTNVGNVYSFTLSAFDLDSLFTTGAFISSLGLDASNQPIVSNVVGDAPVSVSNGGGPGGGWDFLFDFTGPKQARLTALETVSWDATFSQAVSLTSDSFVMHVQGLTEGQGDSAWYTPTPEVPEPETYALMMVGLGLLGFTAKRRKLL